MAVAARSQPNSIKVQLKCTPARKVLRASSSSELSIRFIDFDWAGQDGVDRYPLLMSTFIPWPEGAGDQLLMRQSHDVALLRTGGAGSGRSYYSWYSKAPPSL